MAPELVSDVMSPRRLGLACFVVLLVALAAGLAPLAYASPPDPSWIRGMYDDADGDDAVGLITSGIGSAEPPAPGDLRPDIILIAAAAPIDDRPAASLRSPSRQPRAPPAP